MREKRRKKKGYGNMGWKADTETRISGSGETDSRSSFTNSGLDSLQG